MSEKLAATIEPEAHSPQDGLIADDFRRANETGVVRDELFEEGRGGEEVSAISFDDRDNLRRVERFLDDAHKENRARDVIANDGVSDQHDTWTPGSGSVATFVSKIENEVPTYRSSSHQTYRTGPNNYPTGSAKVERTSQRLSRAGKSTESGAPSGGKGHFQTHSYEHTFTPANQERADQLIRSLADKQGEKSAAARRAGNIRSAQQYITRINTSKS